LHLFGLDRNRRYSISSANCLAEGTPYSRQRWRQIDESPTRLELAVPQPKAAELYYNVYHVVDQHNCDRQDTLCIERKLNTIDWSFCVNLSILAIIFVDTWRVYSKITGTESLKEAFYGHLTSVLTDNKHDIVQPGRSPCNTHFADDVSPIISRVTGLPRSVVSAHLSPTKRREIIGIVLRHHICYRVDVVYVE
jgi:hypothetical protein